MHTVGHSQFPVYMYVYVQQLPLLTGKLGLLYRHVVPVSAFGEQHPADSSDHCYLIK